jgi:hypothetical protein
MLPFAAMATDRIDFISAYCDSWCERCAFTERCSAYACRIAIAMCDDAEAGLELAVGVPQPVTGQRPATAGELLLADEVNVEPSQEELAEFERNETARDERLDAHPLTTKATAYMLQSTAWLKAHRESLASGDAVVREALEIVGWDAYLIGAKVHRALDGRDRAVHDGEEEDDPVQNDANGSAKVALISIRRSEAAWALIAQAVDDPAAATLGGDLSELGRLVEEQFPRAMSFVRPGFDEPWR